MYRENKQFLGFMSLGSILFFFFLQYVKTNIWRIKEVLYYTIMFDFI